MNILYKKLFYCMMVALTFTGCIHTADNVGGNDKPVAPETISNESGRSGDPSLPYMKPWWMD